MSLLEQFETTLENVVIDDVHGIITIMLARQDRMRTNWRDLLPMVRANTANLLRLDKDQQEVVDMPLENKHSATIIANAGTGKTFTLLRRVLRLCLDHPHLCPADFTLVAFNNKAARQLHDKWFELVGLVNAEDVPAPRCTTLHALGYLTTMSLRGKHGILTEREKFKFIRDWLINEPEANPRAYGEALEHIALSGVLLYPGKSEDEIIDVGCRAENLRESIEPVTLLKLRQAYEAFKAKENKLDFEDLPLWGGILAGKMPSETRTLLYRLHKFIYCDEGQDLDRTQYNLIRHLTENLTIIGDVKQTLYTWRQADPSIMVRHSLNRKFLTHNYRSDPRIVSFANRAHKLFPNQNPPSISTRDRILEGSAIDIQQAKNPEQELAGVTARIAHLVANGADPNGIAVLTRTNNECRRFEAALFAARVPYRIKQHRTTIAESPEFLTLSALARLERNPNDAQAILTLAEHTKGIGGKTLEQLAEKGKINNTKLQGIIDSYKTMADRIAEGTPDGDEEKIAYWATIIKDNPDLNINLDTLSDSVSLMFEVVRRPTDPDLALLADNPMDVIALSSPDAAKGEKPKVTLSTVHAVKGLEFEYVFLPFMNLNPYLPPSRHPQEGACWLYTALTRAKQYLYVSFSKEMNPPQQNFTNGRAMRPRLLDMNAELMTLLTD